MEINGLMTYENLLRLPRDGARRIHLEIFRSGGARPIEADFAYEHPPGP